MGEKGLYTDRRVQAAKPAVSGHWDKQAASRTMSRRNIKSGSLWHGRGCYHLVLVHLAYGRVSGGTARWVSSWGGLSDPVYPAGI